MEAVARIEGVAESNQESVAKSNQVWAYVIVGFLTLLTMATYAVNEYYIY
ncbi:MAG: hypothetical protein HY848_15700, partial [Betaproteobacteria bacterium]|nr:hypothetical protein [Betaproteobacteria bacterium]